MTPAFERGNTHPRLGENQRLIFGRNVLFLKTTPGPKMSKPTTRLLPWVACVCLCCANAPAAAQIYAGENSQGTILLSNFKSAEAAELIVADRTDPVAASISTPRNAFPGSTIPTAFQSLLEDAANEYGLDPYLLHAVIKVESGYDPRALSPKGARGLMQLMPDTARRFGANDPLNPRENVKAGARYLSWLLQLFKGDLELALAGYNAGEQAVIRAGYRIPPFTETRAYVPRVLNYYPRVGKRGDRANPTSPGGASSNDE